MARKKKQEEHVNHERWLVSYADFITLLFAFFVVMYSVSSVNEGKFRVLSDALLSAFHSPPKSLDPIQVGLPSKSPVLSELQFKSTPNILISQRKGVAEINEDGAKKLEDSEDKNRQPDNDASLGKISEDIMLAMANLIDLGVINVRRTDLWLEIEIKNSILFTSGSATLKETVLPVLKELARILYAFPNAVRVEGYTDSDKINTVQFPSNWELSAARASSIARLFELSRILSERLSVVGYGATRPVADNSTAEGKEKNRRVIIVVVANNDVAKTIKGTSDGKNFDFPGNDKMTENGLLDKNTGPIDFASINNNSGPEAQTDTGPGSAALDERELSIYRTYIPGSVPTVSENSSPVKIFNPSLSSPIRMFSPIELPQPIIMNNQSTVPKE